MEVLAYLIPVAVFLGLVGLVAFFWALRSGQFEDLEGAGMRILIDDKDALNEGDQQQRSVRGDNQDNSAKQFVDPEGEPK